MAVSDALLAALTAGLAETSADRLFDVSGSDTHGPATGVARLVVVARQHGTLRAREDGSLDGLLAEYRALRVGVAAARTSAGPAHESAVEPAREPDAAPALPMPPRLHAAIDQALAAAAVAFGRERERQRQTVRAAHDHAMRGALNAIRLAALVRRQTGADTSEIVERHSLRLQALLDHGYTAEGDDRALRPEELPARDLVQLAREVTARWNDAAPGRRATCVVDAPCMGRFDLERVGQALTALLDAVGARAAHGAAVRLSVARDVDRVAVRVEAAPPATSAHARPVVADGPLVELLTAQTAAAHHGRLEAIDTAGGAIGYRLTLSVGPLARPPAADAPPAGG